MKVTVGSSKILLEDASGGDAVRITGGPYLIQRNLKSGHVDIFGPWGVQRIKTANVTHLNGSAFTGTTQDLMDAIVTGLP